MKHFTLKELIDYKEAHIKGGSINYEKEDYILMQLAEMQDFMCVSPDQPARRLLLSVEPSKYQAFKDFQDIQAMQGCNLNTRPLKAREPGSNIRHPLFPIIPCQRRSGKKSFETTFKQNINPNS